VDWSKPEDLINKGYKGLIKCHIIPPKGLRFPVIPARIPKDPRFLMALCLKCAKQFAKSNTKVYDEFKCTHSDEERGFTTTTTTIELEEALKHNYRVTKLYRVWHYDHWSNEIFREYMKTFLKVAKIKM
jgi:hypothetical protein